MRSTLAPPGPVALVSRAVSRSIDPGNDASCSHCGHPVKFMARNPQRQVIANVYVDEVWNRVEHFHAPCYDEAGQPFGVAD